MDMIEEYIAAAIEHESLNKAGLTPKTVRLNNKLADKMRHIAMTIESDKPEIKPEFAKLIFHKNANVRGWCAHHMLEVMTFQDEHRINALKEIAARTEDDYGEKLWLEQWSKKFPADRKIIENE